MSFQFNEAELQEVQRIRARYPDSRSATLPLLHLAQRRVRWIPPDVIDEVARVLELPRVHVSDVVSFYTMFQRKPVGTHLISVCRTLSCHVLGGKEIIDYLHQRLGLGDAHSGTDASGTFTLEEVECLGSCGTAPVLLVNGVYHENMTVDSVRELLDRLERESAPAAAPVNQG